MITRMILTTEGIKPMQDITPGYSVYSYEDGSPLMISDVEVMTIDQFAEVRSSDGRLQRMTIDEFSILAGYKVIPFREIKFNESRVRISKQPDPYTAGFIFFSTDLEEDRISVPTERLLYMSAPIRKYHMVEGETKNGRTYLKWEANGNDFTLSNFFIGHQIDRSSKYRIIPFAYQYGLHHERMQFIQGVFDAGHMDSQEPYGVTVAHKSCELIEAIQRVLWSLNIPSLVEYTDDLGYVLSADTNREIAANYYYNEEFIERCLKRGDVKTTPDDVLYRNVHVYKLPEPQIVKIPKLQKPGALYVDVDYMPIASC